MSRKSRTRLILPCHFGVGGYEWVRVRELITAVQRSSTIVMAVVREKLFTTSMLDVPRAWTPNLQDFIDDGETLPTDPDRTYIPRGLAAIIHTMFADGLVIEASNPDAD